MEVFIIKQIIMNKFIITEEEKDRILNMHKSRTSNQYLMEQKIGDFTYSVVDVGNGKFRIYVTGGKYTTPTDAETVFGKATYWVDYKTKEAAQEKINSMVNTEKMKTGQPIKSRTMDRSGGMMR